MKPQCLRCLHVWSQCPYALEQVPDLLFARTGPPEAVIYDEALSAPDERLYLVVVDIFRREPMMKGHARWGHAIIGIYEDNIAPFHGPQRAPGPSTASL